MQAIQQSSIYTAENQYPKIQVDTKNAKGHAVLLLDNIGGNNSKMTMYTLYLYNAVIAESEDMRQLFNELAQIELLHLTRFAEYVRLLGQEPRLWSDRCGTKHYWTPAYGAYTAQPIIMLQNAIACEQAAIEKYTRQTERIKDTNICAELLCMIKDDEVHLQLLKDMIKTI